MSRSLSNGFLARNGRVLRRLCRIGFAISIVVIIVLSLLPGDDMPDTGIPDKVAHFIAYAEIVLLGILGHPARLAAICVLAGVAALGGALEIGQMYVPGRSADIADFAVNCLGMLTGYAAARIAGAVARA
jgi:VanZ family protein